MPRFPTSSTPREHETMKISTPHALALAVLVAVLGCIAGCGGGSEFSSPEATFATAKAAATKGDYKTFCDCLTTDAQDQLAAGFVFLGGFMQLAMMGDDEDAKAMATEIRELLEKHGVTEDSSSKVNIDMNASEKDQGKEMRKLAAPIKDRPAFIAEFFAVLEKHGKDKTKPFESDAKLVDLKTEGDTATATVVQTSEGKEEKNSIEFKKVDGAWKIALGPKMM